MSKSKIILCTLFLACMMAGCALGDTSTTTSLPPMTLPAPPTLNFAGTCDDTKQLETWLQITSKLRADFQTLMNTTAVKNRAEIYEDVLNLAALRDSAFAVNTPDCTAETAIKLSDAMTQTVIAFQLFVNGDAPDLGNTITEVNTRMDEVAAAQTELIARMDAQFQQQRQVTEEP